jgi:hypothetical protein
LLVISDLTLRSHEAESARHNHIGIYPCEYVREVVAVWLLADPDRPPAAPSASSTRGVNMQRITRIPTWSDYHVDRPSTATPLTPAERVAGHLPGNPGGTGAGDGTVGPPPVHGVSATGDELPGNP